MTRRLLLSYLSLTVIVLASLEIPLAVIYAHSEHQDASREAERSGEAVATLVEDNLENALPPSSPLVVSAATRYARAMGGRVMVLNQLGVARIDTGRPSLVGRSYAAQPEVRSALDGRPAGGVLSVGSGPSRHDVAVPVASGGEVHGAILLTYSTSSVEGRIHEYLFILLGIAVVALVAAGLVGWRFASRVTRPLRAVERAAGTAGAGDLAVRAPVAGPPEVRSLGESFNGMIVKLESLMHAQTEFVADASHQLRTPLAALRLTLENLEHDAVDRDLEPALREVDRLSQTVNGLLALARVDREQQAGRALDLEAVVAERVALWSPLAAQHNVVLSSRLDRSWWVRGGPDRLEQVIDNLLENALEASPPGGVVTISAMAADSRIELHVVDTGPGLTDEERVRAFDRFWRKGSGGDGSGLGLAIVARLVRVDGGEVELRRAETGGIDAVVRLRTAKAPTPARTA